jgi:hydroxyacylglutathione hydrolase
MSMNGADHLEEPFEGFILMGVFAPGECDVASLLLYHDGEACLLEVPPDPALIYRVRDTLGAFGLELKYIAATHRHFDHWDERLVELLLEEHPGANILPNGEDVFTHLGGELLVSLHCPKHSWSDQVVIFRGVAATGDIELGMWRSVNDEVDGGTREESLRRLAAWPRESGYQIHTLFSAHWNDIRRDIHDFASCVLPSDETD